MATSLNPTTETTDSGAKKYLDYSGLNKLWDNICDKFAPQWKSVNFDFIAETEPTHEASTVVIPFRNLSMPPTAEGVVDHAHVNQTSYTIQAATQTTAGVLSAADKKKIDELGETTENAITIKQVKVGNTLDENGPYTAAALTIETEDGSKDVAFGLSYDAETDMLSIMDLNHPDGPTALSSVHVLGDALKTLNGFSDVDVTTENGITYLEFTLTVTDQNGDDQSKSVKVNVSDLVSVYNAGNGISLSVVDDVTNDDKETSVTINVIPPKYASNKNTIGGVIPKKVYTGTVASWDVAAGTTAPTVQALGTQTGRYFGIETDKDGRAFVNVPSATASIGTSTIGTDTINNTAASDEFTAVTDIEFTLSNDGKTYTIVPKKTKFTVTQETEITKDTNSASIAKKDISLNGSEPQSFDVISDFEISNDHKIKFNKVTHTIKETAITIAKEETPDTNNINLVPGAGAQEIRIVKEITEGAHHTIIEDSQNLSISVTDPASIELTYIQGLTYAVPTA